MNEPSLDATVRGDTRSGGRERILSAAMEILHRDGEAALKFAEIADRAGVAVSVITHHFGTREGLLSVLYAKRFEGQTGEDLDAVRMLATHVTSRAQLAAGMSALTEAVVNEARSEVRLARIGAIGATHGRPELAREIARSTTALIDGLEFHILTAQAKGLIDRTLNARVFATFIQTYVLGMIITDLDEKPVSRRDLADLIDRLVQSVLTDPET